MCVHVHVCEHVGSFRACFCVRVCVLYTACVIHQVVVGWAGSVHDGRMLRRSDIAKRAERGRAFPPGYFLIGDSGYALREWLIVPYPSTVRILTLIRIYKCMYFFLSVCLSPICFSFTSLTLRK